MSFSVVIPSRTTTNLVACVEACRRHEPGCGIVAVDDGLDVAAMLARSWEPFSIVPGGKPFVFARNCNLGIAAAGGEDVILLNDDATLMTPGGFTALSQCAGEHPEYGVISAVTNCAGNPRQFPRNQGLRPEHDTVAFVCVYIPRHAFEKIGPLDERFVAYGWEDNDYCKRSRLAGLRVGIFDGCFVDHRSLKSTFRGSPNRAGDIEPGRRIFREKWGT